MKARLILLIGITATVFPAAWLTERSHLFDTLYNAFFETELSRVIMHTAIYAALALLLANLLLLDTPHRRHYVLLGLILLAVALGQELAQLAWRGNRGFGEPEFNDLIVDSIGTLLGLALFRKKRQSFQTRS